MSDGDAEGPTAMRADDYRELYTQVCENYRAIDDFRMKLLALLPVATGAGVLALLNSGKVDLDATGADLERIQQVLGGAAIFGVAITLGLFFYELHGIKKCGQLMSIGARIEKHMEPSGFYGQFATRPERVAGLIDVPLASSLVYSAAVAVWVFVGLVSLCDGAWAVSAGTLLVLAFGSAFACRCLSSNLKKWDDEQTEAHRATDAHRATATNA